MPNRRRRKLSTALSAAAALAVASPCAYFLVYESTAGTKPIEHHEFKRAAQITDLPGEVMGALTQGLSQFGINLPPVPGLSGTSPGTSGLTSPGVTTSPLSPGLTSSPGLGGTTPGSLAAPGTAITPTAGAGVNPALTSPAGVTPGAISPGAANPTIGAPIGAPGEVPITSPAVGLDPGADGTYPILGGDPSLSGLGASPVGAAAPAGGGGLFNDLMQAANQLGAGQAIDLIKGLVMPAIMQGVQGGGGAAPALGAPGAGLPGGGIPAPSLPAGLQGARLPAGAPAAALPGAAGPGVLPPAAGAPAIGAPVAAVPAAGAAPTLASAPVEALPSG